ncbi:phosphonate ABC transporter ATP-binding protein [Metamycoplasma equirhinis]|uniref:phosphonate ABC transporter ATP-binding protein n=1 Tax=Metamycoplasma equirhinis TaxID=92402 RepID=UPI003593EDAC
MNAIKFENVNAKYKNSHELVLKNANLTIEEGEMIAIIGLSGAGKTTIFNSILRQLDIVTGQILVNKKNILDYSKKQWKRTLKTIGYLSQSPNLIEDLNVYENILLFYSKYKNILCSLFKHLTKTQRKEVFSILGELDLFEKAFTKVSELSGGQKQRVEIAKLLLEEVSIILADEPTSNLDIKTAMDVLEILKQINKKYNKTIIINIHDLTLLKKYFNNFIFVKDGQIICRDSVQNLTAKRKKELFTL